MVNRCLKYRFDLLQILVVADAACHHHILRLHRPRVVGNHVLGHHRVRDDDQVVESRLQLGATPRYLLHRAGRAALNLDEIADTYLALADDICPREVVGQRRLRCECHCDTANAQRCQQRSDRDVQCVQYQQPSHRVDDDRHHMARDRYDPIVDCSGGVRGDRCLNVGQRGPHHLVGDVCADDDHRDIARAPSEGCEVDGQSAPRLPNLQRLSRCLRTAPDDHHERDRPVQSASQRQCKVDAAPLSPRTRNALEHLHQHLHQHRNHGGNASDSQRQYVVGEHAVELGVQCRAGDVWLAAQSRPAN